MCITSLPYCPPPNSRKITTLLFATINTTNEFPSPEDPSSDAANALSALPDTIGSNEPYWFICIHPSCPGQPNSAPSPLPSTCMNLEIRHPGFNGARCRVCTQVARRIAITVNTEAREQEIMRNKLREEIERMEKVLLTLKMKLRSMETSAGTGTVRAGDDGQGGRGREGDVESEGKLKEVLERDFGKGWGGVL